MPDQDCLLLRVSEMEIKLKTHQELHESHLESIANLSASLHENTALTKKIADNTGELVELFKGAKVARRFFIWLVPIVASCIGAWKLISDYFGVR